MAENETPPAAAEAAAQDKEKMGEKAAGKKGLPLPILMGIIVVVQVGLSFFVLSMKVAPQLAGGKEGKPAAHEAAKEPVEPGPLVNLEPMVLNLATLEGEKPSFAKLGLAIEMDAPEKGGGGGHGEGGNPMGAVLPLVRDAVITTVSAHTMADVTNPDGKERLRKELLESLNRVLGEGKVRNIYFTNFVIQ